MPNYSKGIVNYNISNCNFFKNCLCFPSFFFSIFIQREVIKETMGSFYEEVKCTRTQIGKACTEWQNQNKHELTKILVSTSLVVQLIQNSISRNLKEMASMALHKFMKFSIVIVHGTNSGMQSWTTKLQVTNYLTGNIPSLRSISFNMYMCCNIHIKLPYP
jgi:hypothetical protein